MYLSPKTKYHSLNSPPLSPSSKGNLPPADKKTGQISRRCLFDDSKAPSSEALKKTFKRKAFAHDSSPKRDREIADETFVLKRCRKSTALTSSNQAPFPSHALSDAFKNTFAEQFPKNVSAFCKKDVENSLKKAWEHRDKIGFASQALNTLVLETWCLEPDLFCLAQNTLGNGSGFTTKKAVLVRLENNQFKVLKPLVKIRRPKTEHLSKRRSVATYSNELNVFLKSHPHPCLAPLPQHVFMMGPQAYFNPARSEENKAYQFSVEEYYPFVSDCFNFESAEQIKTFVNNIQSALNHLHQNGWIHRDVCAENIFVNEEGQAILGDLETMTAIENASDFTSPRFKKRIMKTANDDLWALGLVIESWLSQYIGKKATRASIESSNLPNQALCLELLKQADQLKA